jgi:transposase
MGRCRRVLNGIFWVLRTGAPWRALPKEFGPQTTCYNRFVRWSKAGVWDCILAAGDCPIAARLLGQLWLRHNESVS